MKTCSRCFIEKPISEYNTKYGKPISVCKECCSLLNKEYRHKNKEKEKERLAQYWKQIKGTDKQRMLNSTKCKTYREKHPEVFRFYAAKRRCANLQATPTWSDLMAINAFYAKCPEGHHVDHIIPLRGKRVCGLHVLENLQYLTKEENLSKSNNY